jgi:hypothetical protein
MIDERPLGIIVTLIGAVGVVISALADPLGIGVGDFGWLQTLGVILGAVLMLIGIALATEWMPYPGRTRGDAAVAPANSPQTTVVTDSRR